MLMLNRIFVNLNKSPVILLLNISDLTLFPGSGYKKYETFLNIFDKEQIS